MRRASTTDTGADSSSATTYQDRIAGQSQAEASATISELICHGIDRWHPCGWGAIVRIGRRNYCSACALLAVARQARRWAARYNRSQRRKGGS
jgi:hypothetical protein